MSKNKQSPTAGKDVAKKEKHVYLGAPIGADDGRAPITPEDMVNARVWAQRANNHLVDLRCEITALRGKIYPGSGNWLSLENNYRCVGRELAKFLRESAVSNRAYYTQSYAIAAAKFRLIHSAVDCITTIVSWHQQSWHDALNGRVVCDESESTEARSIFVRGRYQAPCCPHCRDKSQNQTRTGKTDVSMAQEPLSEWACMCGYHWWEVDRAEEDEDETDVAVGRPEIAAEYW